MIETTEVLSDERFSLAPASRNICGFTATTSVSTAPRPSIGLSATPLAASAVISGMDADRPPRRGADRARRPAIPVSIAPPILPAPASRMVPVMFCRVLLFQPSLSHNHSSSRRKPGPITTGGSSGWRKGNKHRRIREITRYGSRPSPGRRAERCRSARLPEDALRLAHRIEHRRVHRLRGGLAGPHHELERRDNSVRRRGWRRRAWLRIARSRRSARPAAPAPGGA